MEKLSYDIQNINFTITDAIQNKRKENFMKKRRMVTRIYAFILAASLIAADTLPAFAAERSRKLVSDDMAVLEENFSDKSIPYLEDAQREPMTETMEETKSEPMADTTEGAESKPETETTEETKPEPGTEEAPDDGLIRVNDTLYSGYYMDQAGIFYLVTEGVAKPFYGMANTGTSYYNCDISGAMTLMTLPTQTIFVEGKSYSGYYMDTAGMFYIVTAGTPEPVNRTVKDGTPYYGYDETGALIPLTLSKQTVFVNGKVYSGYYLSKQNKMYYIKKGTSTRKTGILKKGTNYYNYPLKKTKNLSKDTLYVNGTVYSGYYMNKKNHMYHVKKGTLTLKTGILKKGIKYYSYPSKKTKKLSKETLYVNGKIYSGYYMNKKNHMYHVKKGTLTLKTGILKKGVKYYSYPLKKTKKLSKETLYINGKLYTGYYLNQKNKMYRVKKGIPVLAIGMMGKGTKYYNYKLKKTQTLSQETLYVDGIVYNGYYLGSDNKMYLLSNGTYTPVNTALGAGTAYYSCVENRMVALPAAKAYVYGKAVESLTPAGVVTFQKAQAVVQTITAPTDSPADKLYKCYLWMEKFPYMQYRTMAEGLNISPDDWDVIFADDIFDANAGCCVSLSCAFAYMAKACGFESVTICSDTKHAWVDIDGRLYDPLFAKDRNFSKNYNAAYTDYRVHAAITREL